VLNNNKIINQYFTHNLVVKCLYCIGQLELFRPAQYYIVYDFETMEEIISKDDEQNAYMDVEERKECSCSSSSSCDINCDILKRK
jgi:hypothetical protein